MRKTYNLGILSLLAASAFATASASIRGTLHGGQTPIQGAHIYLLAPAQSTTPGAASVSLIASGPGTATDSIGTYVTTDLNGDWNFENFNCPANPNVPVYLYSGGGDAGTGYGHSGNPAIAETAYVSLCNVAASAPFVFIDEVTTVAMAYAAAGYATDPLHVSYSGTQASLTGIANAFANASNLANMNQGIALNTIPSGYAKAPETTVNTLADAIATCINQTPGSNYCQTLFSATMVNGTPPSDTATALMNIAHNPASSTAARIQNGTNIALILQLAGNSSTQFFQPILSSEPNDLTLGLTFASANIPGPTALAVDASGNVWVASQPTTANSVPSVVEIANPTSMSVNNNTYPVVYTPQTEPDSIAVDGGSQNIWIGTDGGVEEISSTTGQPASGSPFLTNDPNFTGPSFGLNLDTAGNVWIAGYTYVYELSPTGSNISPNGYYSLPLQASASPSALALDGSNNVWVTDYYNNALVELTSQGEQNFDSAVSGNAFNYPNGVAIDASRDVWVANNGNNNFVEYASTAQTSFTVSQADVPPQYSNPVLTFVALDGAGNSWYSLEGGACNPSSVCLGVAEVSGAGTPLSGPGYAISNSSGVAATVSATAIDGSGDVWLLNKLDPSVTELIGAATPVVTPLALAVSTNGLGARP